MAQQNHITALAQAIGADIKALQAGGGATDVDGNAVKLQIKSLTRAQLEAAATRGTLIEREPYLITDEGRLAVATTASTFTATLKEGAGAAGIARYSYGARAGLRTDDSAGYAVVDSLGLFAWYPGSAEPDDDESCFATATGCWLLQAASWDLVDAWQLPEVEERDAYDEDEPLRFAAKVITGSATCAITSVTSVSSASFTGTVTGAAIGDRVIATPPAGLGNSAAETGRLGYHAWVSDANTVTVMLTNASAAAANTNPAIRTAWPITVIKS